MTTRGSWEWLDHVAENGTWWEPQFWDSPEYLAASPWPGERLSAAFAGLRRLYPAKEARAAFAWVRATPPERDELSRRPIWKLLACPMRPDLSGLARLGLDVVDADLFAHGELVRKLRTDVGRELKGARFELRSLAAFRNAGIRVEYEPLAGKGGSNPDFRVHLARHLYVDAKHAEEGEWAKEELRWFFKLTMRHDPSVPGISAQVRLTDRFQQLQDEEDGRRYIRENIERLSGELSRAKVRLATSGGPFPVTEVIEGLIEVEVLGPPGRTSSGGTQGVPTDARREVARVVRGVVTDYAKKVPPDEVGVVLLNPGLHAPSHLLVEELKRWMTAEGEGAGYPNLAGVLALSEVLVEPVPGVMGTIDTVIPVWRETAPDWVVNGPWHALSAAFAWQDVTALAKRCDDAEARGDT